MAAFLPLPLSAGGWAAFEERCLLPYSQIFAPHADGLQALDGDGRFALPGGDVLILGDFEACAVENGPEIAGAFETWLEREIAAGRFLRDEDGSALSTTWREPRMRVTLMPETNTVIAEETDLES
ncbi:hypothetical protein [Actibacterium mucosum]|uniref:hypothetical protein n=1 Tax=Actibacterium mucosum TaxID=1087332 RepID=UPI0012683FD2|nr:hypothetical protein [Actibacterium mucosum]